MATNRALKLGIALFSAGWVIPFSLATSMYESYMTQEFLPVMLGSYPMSSFPHMSAAMFLMKFGLAWLGLVIAVWVYRTRT